MNSHDTPSETIGDKEWVRSSLNPSHGIQPCGQFICASICKDFSRPATPGRCLGWRQYSPNIIRIVEHSAERTIYTRFIPPQVAEDTRGTWRNYYRLHDDAIRGKLNPAALQLLAPLVAYAPPAIVIDKPVYSAFLVRTFAKRS
jgi:hypothetical protein